MKDNFTRHTKVFRLHAYMLGYLFPKLCTIKRTTLSVRAAAVFMYPSEHLDGQILELFEPLENQQKVNLNYCVKHVSTKI